MWGFDVARCLAASGQVVLHGFAQSAAPAARHSGLFASFEENTGECDVKAWLVRIGRIVKEKQIDVVLPASVFAIRSLSEHRQELSWAAQLPDLPKPHTFDVATDKATLADFLGTHGLPHPPTAILTTGTLAHDRLSALEFPVLAKPPLGYGGRGIKRFENLKGITGFLAERPIDERWVVQSFIEGSDVDVNVLCREGQIVAATVQHAIKASSKQFQPAIGIEFKEDP